MCYRVECAVEVIVHEGGIQQWRECGTAGSVLQESACYKGQHAIEGSLLQRKGERKECFT